MCTLTHTHEFYKIIKRIIIFYISYIFFLYINAISFNIILYRLINRIKQGI